MKDALEQISHKFDARWSFFYRLRRGDRILELGCGTGDNFRELSRICPDIEFHGVDLYSPQEAPPRILYQRVDLDHDSLPYNDAFFDGVILTHVLEHLREPLRIGREINRVMKPGGIIYVEAPNWTSTLVPSFGFQRKQSGPFNFYDDPTHVRPWTKHGIFSFIGEICSLDVERVAIVRNWPRLPWDLVKIVFNLVRKRRRKVIAPFWNIYGWCVYGVGVKR